MLGRDLDLRIEGEQGVARGLDLGAADVGAAMDDLALEIRKLHRVVVAEHDVTDTRSGEVHRHRRSEAAEPDHEHPGSVQPLLPLLPNLRKPHVAAVSASEPVIHPLILDRGVVRCPAGSGPRSSSFMTPRPRAVFAPGVDRAGLRPDSMAIVAGRGRAARYRRPVRCRSSRAASRLDRARLRHRTARPCRTPCRYEGRGAACRITRRVIGRGAAPQCHALVFGQVPERLDYLEPGAGEEGAHRRPLHAAVLQHEPSPTHQSRRRLACERLQPVESRAVPQRALRAARTARRRWRGADRAPRRRGDSTR